MSGMDMPRPAPVQKPLQTQMEVPHPLVPEVTLMFDSNDSLIWPPRSAACGPTASTQNSDPAFCRSENNEERTGILKVPGSHVQVPTLPINDTTCSNTGYVIQSSPQIIFQYETPKDKNMTEKLYLTRYQNSMRESPQQLVPTRTGVHLAGDHDGELCNTHINRGSITRTPNSEKKAFCQNVPPVHKTDVLMKSVKHNECPEPSQSRSVHFHEGAASVKVSKNNFTSEKAISYQKLQSNSPITSSKKNSQHLERNENISNMSTVSPQAYIVSAPSSLKSCQSINAPSSVKSCQSNSHGCETQNTEASRKVSAGATHYTVDPHVMQLIEGQNQQIMLLQKILEKLLDRNNEGNRSVLCKNTDSHDLSGNCSCNNKRVAIVQTSFHGDDSSSVKSVGVNTDISMATPGPVFERCMTPDGTPTLRTRDNKTKTHYRTSGQTTPNQNQNTAQGRNSIHHSSPGCCRNNNSPCFRNFPDNPVREKDLADNEESAILQNLNFNVLEDPPSPEPTIHVNYDDVFNEQSQRHVVRDALNCNCTLNDGRDVHVLSRRGKLPATVGDCQIKCDRNNMPDDKIHDSHSDSQEGDSPNMTYYSNVKINIQQVVQNTKASEHEEQRRSDLRTNIPAPGDLPVLRGRVEEKEDPQVEAVRKQLMQFGISFIDPTTFADKRQPVLDSICIPGLQTMLGQGNLETPLTPQHCHDEMAAKYLTPAQIAALAAHSVSSIPLQDQGRAAAGRELFQHSSGQNSSTNPSNFSTATKEFLERYGLEQDLN